jgi:hypothetical protein
MNSRGYNWKHGDFSVAIGPLLHPRRFADRDCLSSDCWHAARREKIINFGFLEYHAITSPVAGNLTPEDNLSPPRDGAAVNDPRFVNIKKLLL